jgi:hypothetical protein
MGKVSSNYSTILELLFVCGLACRRDATSYTTRYSTGLRTTEHTAVLAQQQTTSRPSVYLLFLFALIFDFDFGTVYMR